MHDLLPLLLAALACPPGATPKGAEPPAGLHAWCEDKAGRKDGPEREWYAGGAAKAEGAWKAGAMHGRWKGWREDGTLFLDESYADGEPAATVDAKSPPPGPAAKGGLTDVTKHPMYERLKAYVRASPDAEAAELKRGLDQVATIADLAAKPKGGSVKRRSEPGLELMLMNLPDKRSKITVRTDSGLTQVLAVDVAARVCTEQIDHPDIDGDLKKTVSTRREIDCAWLAKDADLGADARRVGSTTPRPLD